MWGFLLQLTIFIVMKITYKKGKLIIPIAEGDPMLIGRFKK